MINRKQFIRTVSLAAASLPFAEVSSKPLKENNLGFSTLACPKWNFPHIAAFAKRNNYKWLEIRGIEGEMNLPNSNVFNTDKAIENAKAIMKDNGLRFINLGSSATFHYADEARVEKNIEDAKQFIDLAAKLNCPYVRVYPNNYVNGEEKSVTIDRIVKALDKVGNYAADKGVVALMETHGDFLHSADLKNIMEKTTSPALGLIWDFCNMYTKTKEPVAEMYAALQPYIKHVHLKDAFILENGHTYTYLLNGEVPVAEVVSLLKSGNYAGVYSFEWEKAWIPSLAEPQLALADYVHKMKKIL